MPPASIDPGLLGTANFTSPGSLRRIDDDDVAAPVAAMLQHVDEARMVGARVGADDEDQVGAGQVLELDRGSPRADGARQPLAGRLVAVIRAVVDVVGAPGPRQQLEDEAGLVRRAAGGVEEAAPGVGGT